MSPAVFAAALAQETNVFGPLPTGLNFQEYAHVTRPRWPMDPTPPAPWRVAIRSPHNKS
jgi:hypothetical protein